jgi:MFS family permease
MGLVILGGATVMLCIGTSIAILVVGRLLQGLSAAVVWTTGLALLVDTVGQEEIGQTMGIISMAYSIGILIGPLLGGVVYASSGYYAVFYMAFGLIAIDIVLRFSFVEKKVAARWLGVNGIASPGSIATANTGPTSHELHPRDNGIEMEAQSQRGDEPAQPRRSTMRLPPVVTLLGSRRLLAAFWGCLVVAALSTAFDSTLPLYVKRIFGWNSLGSGLLFLALLLPSMVGPVIGMNVLRLLVGFIADINSSGRLSDKYGPRWPATIGFVASLPFWILLRLVTHDSIGQKVLLCALLFLIGTCIAVSMTPLIAEFTYVVVAKEKQHPGLFGASGAYAQAYGLFNSAWAAGCIVGPIWAGFIQAKAGWGTVTWTLGVLSAVSALPVVVNTGGLISRKHSHIQS